MFIFHRIGRTRGAVRRLALVSACLFLVVLPPAVAFAAQITYASGTNGVGGTFATSGEAVRGYNQVWHQAGRYWWVWYLHGSTQTGLVFNSSNPTKYNGGSGTVAYAKCSNSDDNSGVTWTCQTTN